MCHPLSLSLSSPFFFSQRTAEPCSRHSQLFTSPLILLFPPLSHPLQMVPERETRNQRQNFSDTFLGPSFYWFWWTLSPRSLPGIFWMPDFWWRAAHRRVSWTQEALSSLPFPLRARREILVCPYNCLAMGQRWKGWSILLLTPVLNDCFFPCSLSTSWNQSFLFCQVNSKSWLQFCAARAEWGFLIWVSFLSQLLSLGLKFQLSHVKGSGQVPTKSIRHLVVYRQKKKCGKGQE